MIRNDNFFHWADVWTSFLASGGCFATVADVGEQLEAERVFVQPLSILRACMEGPQVNIN